MTLLLCVVTTLLSASPQWLVVPADDDASSRAGADAVSAALVRTGRQSTVVAADHPASACLRLAPAAQPPCLSALRAKLLVVSGAALRERFALTVTVVDASGASLDEASDKGPASEVAGLATSAIATLSSRLTAVEASETSAATVLAPEITGPARRSFVPTLIGGALTVAATAVAIGLTVSGSSQAREVAMLQPGQVTFSRASMMQQDANGTLTAALLTGLGALVFGVVTGVLWFSSP
ncbi:MAG: hypothetical protein Q8L14_09980 [Myxococcales bacterium]|nr:hypothetical protein [Myxococcales bacterium]